MTALPAWLADPALRPLWEVSATRLEKRGLQPAGRVVLDGLDRASRHAVGALLGRPVVSARVPIDLASLDAVLRERSGVGGLRVVVEAALGRRLRDRPAERTATAWAREEPFRAARAWLGEHPSVAAQAWPEEWLAAVRRCGLLARTPGAPRVLIQALQVSSALIGSTAATSRAELAVRHTGDAHGLDDARPLGQLVLRGLAVAAAVDAPTGAAARRALWERFGVAVDSVSSTCLVLGLRPRGSGSRAARLRVAAADGDPVHLSAWDIRRCSPAVPTGTTVLVCENPRVLEAFAERHGGRFTVVCVAGEPNVVTLDVLRTLAEGGASLRYHGDFDWPGIAIANRVRAIAGAEPWLMTAADYLRAAVVRGPGLLGRQVEPSWDRELGRAMLAQGKAVHEEAVVEDLLEAAPSSIATSDCLAAGETCEPELGVPVLGSLAERIDDHGPQGDTVGDIDA